MYCKKCGKKMEEGKKFCTYCEAEKKEVKAVVGKEATEKATTGKLNELKGKFHSLDKKKKGMILGGAALVLLLIIVLACTGKKKDNGIQLSNYVTIETVGYDGYATAEWSFDMEKFEKDWGKKLTFHSKVKRSYSSWTTPMEMFETGLRYGSLDKTTGLSNGDTITFTWGNLPEEFSELFGNKMQYKDLTITVENLEAIECFDPFQDIVIEYKGCEPYATAQIVNNAKDDFLKRLDYRMDNYSDLSEGDTITVTVSGGYYYDTDFTAYCVENYGKAPVAESKEYKVEGLNKYVSSIEQIPDDFLNKMKKEVEDGLSAQVARDWPEYQKLEGMTYIGSYVLNRKGDGWGAGNQIYLVYKVSVHEYDPKNEMDNHFTYYYHGWYENVLLLADGTCSADLTSMTPCKNQFSRDTNIKSWGSYKQMYYKGYEALESLFNKCVTTQIDSYTYENTVQDTVAEVPEETIAPEEITEEVGTTEEETETAEAEDTHEVNE